MTFWEIIEDFPEARTAVLRLIRALFVWPLASWLLAREPIAHPHYLALGLLFALLSCSGMTRWVSSAFIAGLLLFVVVPGDMVKRIVEALL